MQLESAVGLTMSLIQVTFLLSYTSSYLQSDDANTLDTHISRFEKSQNLPASK